MNSFLIYLLKIISTWFHRFKKLWLRHINFILPNVINLFKRRIILSDHPSFNQKMICEGLGVVQIGKNCSFGYKLGGFNRIGIIEVQARYNNAKIEIGNNISTNNNVLLIAVNYIKVGDNTLIGQNVTILDHDAHSINYLKRREIGEIGKVIVGENVWIGNNVIILKNSEIGNNTIVAAGAVVNGKFPSNVIIGGVPAKIIKSL
jgi:acetyltransferase-like isoleucine patch superfamily enzyme